MDNQHILEIHIKRSNYFYRILYECSLILNEIKNEIFNKKNRECLKTKKNRWNTEFIKVLNTLTEIAQGNILLRNEIVSLYNRGFLV